MTQTDSSSRQDVALIVGGGPGISASCARLFSAQGMRVGVAARNPDKAVLQTLEKEHGVRRYKCDASEPAEVEGLFEDVVRDLGRPTLLVHNIDGRVVGIFRKGIAEADPGMALDTLRNSAFSAFLVAQQAARLMRVKHTQRPWHEGHDHLHQRERRAQRLSTERRFRDGVSGQGRACAEHRKRADAQGHPRRPSADRCCDRLDSRRR